MTGRTHVISTHFTRRKARQVERLVQNSLDMGEHEPNGMADPQIPLWAKGARVEKAGLLQWAVVATESKGR